MEDLDFPICILKMNLQCCRDCPLRVKKLLQKVTGVYAITIDPKEGIVLVSGTAEPRVLIKAVEEIGKSPELYAYEKDPSKAKLRLRALLKRYADADADDRDEHSSSAASSSCRVGETLGQRRFGMNPRILGHPPPPPMPMFRLPPQVGPPAYEQPVVAARKQPAPYPFDFYSEKEFPSGDSLFHYFSDQHAQSCSIM
ncbi:PREDICTED: uncharacterized protein LOC104823057 [Tarenaya hassleriana]|uniref:uncharacterized protein LOC104823057 n=1 Tax=Tarenaya hassleriana TaxID=28532 RepID=UPI00053C1F17|nr:PREDICTED: uncharacterized protein LOC104823057 [Tarenaya hassleriana]